MPNYVTCIVRCDEDSMAKIRRYYCDEKGDFSFQKIVPMPDWLCGEFCAGVIEGVMPTEKPESSYGWCSRNWDTKWDAQYPSFETDEDGKVFLRFMTAWSMPDNIFREMSAQLGCQMTVDYADEDMGSNCGHRVYCGHWLNESIDKEGDMDFAAQVRGYKDYREFLEDCESPEEAETDLRLATQFKAEAEAKRAAKKGEGEPRPCPWCGCDRCRY